MVRRKAISIVMLAGLITAGLVSRAPAPSAQAAGVEICDKFETTPIQGGKYYVQNNVWGATTRQCVKSTETGFTVSAAEHNKTTTGAPSAYPSLVFGCHYTKCSENSGLPIKATDPDHMAMRSQATFNLPDSGTWNASYDLWYDRTGQTSTQNSGAEIMIWVNKRGTVRPVGNVVGEATIAGAKWDVWYGPLTQRDTTWNVISYVRQVGTDKADFVLQDFYGDAVKRGHAEQDWYLTSVQVGFEPWVGQKGLGIEDFSVSTSGSPAPKPSTEPMPSASPSESPASPKPSTKPSPTGPTPCTATISTESSWNGGYVAQLAATNSDKVQPGLGWRTKLKLPAGHKAVWAWGAGLETSGSSVTARGPLHTWVTLPGETRAWTLVVTRPKGDKAVPAAPSCDFDGSIS